MVAMRSAVLVAVGLVACSSSNATSSSAAGDSTCSTGTPYDSATVFPERDASQPLPSTACTPRCGDESVGYWGAGPVKGVTVSALPTGACRPGTASCSMSAVRLFCQDGANASGPTGALYQFQCDCTGGEWSCSGNYVGGGIGVYQCPDGGFIAADGGSP